MGQWTRIYDMFWAMFAGRVEWLFVVPELRGQGIAAAIIAEICRQVRAADGEFLQGATGGADIAALYARAAIGTPGYGFHLSAAAFHAFADLVGLRPREIVRRLPSPELNQVAVSSLDRQPASPT